jgi:hypothetical protein
MTKKKKLFGAALMVVALAILPAAVFCFHAMTLNQLAVGLVGTVGVITFTYESFQIGGAFGGGFTGGSNVAPTAAQAAQVQAMTALVGFTDADTTWTFTHNWGLSSAQATALFPEILWCIDSSTPASTPVSMTTFAVNRVGNTNAVVFTKGTAAGSGCILAITLRRPYSAGL